MATPGVTKTAEGGVTKLAGLHKPFGPELQVKQMLDGRRFRGAKKEE